jgi:hypothetical protein
VLPWAPYRLWTLSFPRSVRFALARSGPLLCQVIRAFVRAVFAHLRRRARKLGIADGQPGAVVFVQRFGSFANLNVHLHACFADGVFAKDDDDRVRFHSLAPPDDADIDSIARKVVRTISLVFDRHQLEAECDDLDDALAAAQAAAVHAVPTANAPPGARSLSSLRSRSAFVDGFSLHADTAIHRNDRVGLERVLRYSGRPALAKDRLALDEAGRVTYRFRRPSPSGKLALSIEPVDFLARLATLIPPPRQNQVRYHGVFAAHHKWRPLLVPRTAQLDQTQTRSAALLPDNRPAEPVPSSLPPSLPDAALVSNHDPLSRARLDWAALLSRVFGPDVTRCPRCPGRLRVSAFVTSPDVVVRILDHLGLPTIAPAVAPPRAPPQLDFADEMTDPW